MKKIFAILYCFLLLFSAKSQTGKWAVLGTGTSALNANDAIYHSTIDALGNVYVTGYFKNALGKRYVAKWNGTAWSEVGNLNLPNTYDNITALITDASNNLYIAAYSSVSGNYTTLFYKWNGTTWTSLGSILNKRLENLIFNKQGNLIAAGQSGVFQYNGTSWSQLLNNYSTLVSNFTPYPSSLSLDKQGNLYFTSSFADALGNIFIGKWDGTIWSRLYTGNATIFSKNNITAI